MARGRKRALSQDRPETPGSIPKKSRVKATPSMSKAKATPSRPGAKELNAEELALPEMERAMTQHQHYLDDLAAQARSNPGATHLLPTAKDLGIWVANITKATLTNNKSVPISYFRTYTQNAFGDLLATFIQPLEKLQKATLTHFDLTWEDKGKLMYGDMLRSKTIIQWLVKNKDSVTPLTPEHVAPGAVADDDIMPRDQPNNHTRAIWYHCVFVREVLDIVERLKNDPDEKVKNSPAANLCHGTPVPPGRSSVPVYCPSNVFPGLCGEDLYRILCLFAWYNGYQATKARESKTLERPTPDYCYPVTMNVGGKLVAGKVAYYATHVAGLQDVAEQLRRQEMAFQAASRGELDSAIREQARQLDKTMDPDDVVANLEDKLAIMETRIGNVDEWDDATRLRNIKQAISTVDVVYGDRANAFPLGFIDNSTAQPREFDPSLADHMDEAVREGEASIDGTRVHDHELFAKLNRTMYSESAAPPNFAECVTRLGLDIETDLSKPDAVTGLDFSISFHGLKLKPWQAQGILHLVKHMAAAHGTGYNCDDVGLGKTVMAIAAVVQRAHETEAARREWAKTLMELLQAVLAKLDVKPSDEVTEGGPCEVLKFYRACLQGSEDTQIAGEWEAIETAHVENSGAIPLHGVCVVMVPPTAAPTWIRDAVTFFHAPGTPRHCTFSSMAGMTQNDGGSIATHVAPIMPSTAAALDDHIASFDRAEQATSQHLIFAGMNTLVNNILEKGERALRRIANRPRKKRQITAALSAETVQDSDEDDVPSEDDDDDDPPPPPQPDKPERVMDNTLKIRQARAISVFIVDEGHRLKDPKSQQTDVAYLMPDAKYMILTATPCKNSVGDFWALMRFAWKHCQHLVPESDRGVIDVSQYETLYAELRDRYDRDFLRAVKDGGNHFYALLNPYSFKHHFPVSSTDATKAIRVAPGPMTALLLSRKKGHTLELLGRTLTLGAEIPPWEATHVELRAEEVGHAVYSFAHDQVVDSVSRTALNSILDEGNGPTGRPTPQRRMLTHLVLHGRNGRILENKRAATAAAINALETKSLDTFQYFHMHMKGDHEHAAPVVRIDMLEWLVKISVKMRYLLSLVVKHILGQGNSLIIWVNDPVPRTEVEMVLDLCGIRFVTFRANMTAADRFARENDYNTNPLVKAAVMSTRSASESANLQYGGHIQVFMETTSYTVALQCIGRSNRIGQKEKQLIYFLMQDESVDQALQYSYLRRYWEQISATVNVPPELVQAYMTNMDVATKQEQARAASSKRKDPEELAMLELRPHYASALIRQLFGIRSERLDPVWGWKDLADPQKKNLSPHEKLYRLTVGGRLAIELIHKIRRDKADNAANRLRQIDPSERDNLVYEGPTPVLKKVVDPYSYREDMDPIDDDGQVIAILIEAAQEIAMNPLAIAHGKRALGILIMARNSVPEPSIWIRQAISRQRRSIKKAARGEDYDSTASTTDDNSDDPSNALSSADETPTRKRGRPHNSDKPRKRAKRDGISLEEDANPAAGRAMGEFAGFAEKKRLAEAAQKQAKEENEKQAKQAAEEQAARDEEAKRHDEEMKRLEEETKQLDEEAKQLDEEAKRLDEEAKRKQAEAEKQAKDEADKRAKAAAAEQATQDEETKRKQAEADQQAQQAQQAQDEADTRAKAAADEQAAPDEEKKRKQAEAEKQAQQAQQAQDEDKKRATEEEKKQGEQASGLGASTGGPPPVALAREAFVEVLRSVSKAKVLAWLGSQPTDAEFAVMLSKHKSIRRDDLVGRVADRLVAIGATTVPDL